MSFWQASSVGLPPAVYTRLTFVTTCALLRHGPAFFTICFVDHLAAAKFYFDVGRVMWPSSFPSHMDVIHDPYDAMHGCYLNCTLWGNLMSFE